MPELADNALVLIDDYYKWDGCAQAVHEYLAEQQLPYRIQQGYEEVCFIRKQ